MSSSSIILAPYDVETIRADFPILHQKRLAYLDNGASTQKPQAVIDAESRFYETSYANIHRGVYELSQLATKAYDDARRTVARFINAREEAEVIFTRGTTESINLVASGFRQILTAGDEIILTAMEHHSNIVPWQITAKLTGAVIKVIPVNDAGELRLDEYARLLSSRTKVVAVTHLSNAMGTINDVQKITAMAHERGAAVLVDGAQWVAHYPTDVQAIGCDFYAFSGHKLYGPTGTGVLFGRREWLEKLPPYQGGGDMIETVAFEETTYAPIPAKFEAGTPNIAGVVGLGAAIDYVQSIGLENAAKHEHELLEYATAELQKIPGLRIIGTAAKKGGVISFVLEKPAIATLDIGHGLDREGVAIRTGHHCCMPLMARMGIASTARATLGLYNTRGDVDALVLALKKLVSAKAQATPQAAQDITFAKEAGSSPQVVANEIAETFEFLGERDAKGEQLLDYARQLPHYFDQLKTLTDRVPGCQSQVYLISRPSPADPQRLEFVADADAEIVRGEIYLLQQLFNGQKARDILDFDIQAFFTRIGLETFLSNQRRTGLASMIERIRAHAKRI